MIQRLLFTLEFGHTDGSIDLTTAVATSSAAPAATKTYELPPEHSVALTPEQSFELPTELADWSTDVDLGTVG